GRCAVRALVTGAAGFVGSTLCEHLVASGDEVVGVDCFTDYYERTVKERNLAVLRTSPAFTFLDQDLAVTPLEPLVSSADTAFHRLVHAALTGSPFELYGDGTQTRDFTFVDDVVRAMRNVAVKEWRGVANIGGGERTSLSAAIAVVERLCGPVPLIRRPVVK